jgi:hypothetical protein
MLFCIPIFVYIVRAVYASRYTMPSSLCFPNVALTILNLSTRSAHTMRLTMLPAKTMLLISVVVIRLAPAAPAPMVLHVIHIMAQQLLLIHLHQLRKRKFQIAHQTITPTPREILSHNHPHHLQTLAVRRHSIRRHDPSALTQLVRDGELVEVVFALWVQAESYERQAFAAGLRHEDEAHGLHGGGEVVRRAGEVEHDAAVAGFAETDQLVVLGDDLAGAAGEVEGEGGLVGAEVVDVED